MVPLKEIEHQCEWKKKQRRKDFKGGKTKRVTKVSRDEARKCSMRPRVDLVEMELTEALQVSRVSRGLSVSFPLSGKFYDR